jgi:hypothetical protein
MLNIPADAWVVFRSSSMEEVLNHLFEYSDIVFVLFVGEL